MSAIFLLIGISIVVAGGFLFAFLWAAKTGQFEDDRTPAMRILFDDKVESASSTHNTDETNT